MKCGLAPERMVSVFKLGLIGYGSMGSMLLQGFIKSGALAARDIIVSTRTKSKLEQLKSAWPDINIAAGNAEAAEKAKYVFVCVEPDDVKSILMEIKDCLNADSVIVSAAGSVSMQNIESVTHGKVIRFMPTVTSEVGEGVTLLCCNERTRAEEAAYIEALLNIIGRVKQIPEEEFGPALILTSCGPGLFASMLNEFVESALRQNSGLGRKDAEEMVIATFFGTAKTLLEKNMGVDELIRRVATKGGTTEEGVRVLRTGLPAVFDQMFGVTLGKRRTAAKKHDEEFLAIT